MPKPATRTFAIDVRRAGGEPKTVSVTLIPRDPLHRSDHRLRELQTKNLRAIAERDALRELEQIRVRYAWIENLAEVWQEIDTHQGRPEGSCP